MKISKSDYCLLSLVVLLFLPLINCASKKGPKKNLPYSFKNGRLPVQVGILNLDKKNQIEKLTNCFSNKEGISSLAEDKLYATLRRANLETSDLLQGDDSQIIDKLTNLDLLLLIEDNYLLHSFRKGEKKRRRFKLQLSQLNCEKLLLTIGFFKVSSTPSNIDTWIDRKYYGRTPLYTFLSQGQHLLELFHPEHIFSAQTIFLPADETIHLTRENIKTSSDSDSDGEEFTELSKKEKVGGAIMTLASVVVALGLAFLPIWLLVF